ncbi:MAG TPA: glycosyltransferase family 4 protein [Baekduia sp.]|uniref:glycosyltransferase family 4 protein n=1 Tax=Baekduia sp. TaxID=2600305 RepID=UPI002CBCA215|nr:glycosyltransferase family 4 protein [Baekduia sp.]HMJ32990.1 glycosyltransferase family 4 protein [Baekduia sp.]
MMIAHAFPPTMGGVETHLADLARALQRRGHNVACLVGGHQDVDEMHAGVAVHRRAAIAPGEMIRARSRVGLQDGISRVVVQVLDAAAPQVVHLHNAHHFGTELAEAVFRAAAHHGSARPALVNSVHDHTGEHLCPSVVELPWDHLIYVSDFMRRALPSSRPSSTLLLGIDVDAFATAGAPHQALAALEPPVVFHPARLLRWKGVEVGLEAFLLLRAALGRGSLVLCMSEQIVGDRLEIASLREELRATARHRGAEAHVHFHDFPRDEIAAAYHASDLVWYPTLEDEPYGLVPLEAMAAGVPLIVSDSGGMTETVQPGVTALVVPKGDAGALAEAALRILRDEPLRASLVTAGRRHVTNFALQPFVSRVEALYGRCVGAREAS